MQGAIVGPGRPSRPWGRRQQMPEPSSTILLVDDEDAIQKLLTYPLERDGYRVVQARDGEEALAPLRGGERRPRRARHHAAKSRRARGLPAPPRRRAPCRSSCSLPATTSSTRCSGSSSAPTTTSRSRSRSASSAAGCGRCCAARRPRITRAAATRSIDRGDVVIDLPRRTVEVRGEPVQLTFVEFELLALLASEPGIVFSRASAARADPRRRRLPRAADDRRPRPPPAREDRARRRASRS